MAPAPPGGRLALSGGRGRRSVKRMLRPRSVSQVHMEQDDLQQGQADVNGIEDFGTVLKFWHQLVYLGARALCPHHMEQGLPSLGISLFQQETAAAVGTAISAGGAAVLSLSTFPHL